MMTKVGFLNSFKALSLNEDVNALSVMACEAMLDGGISEAMQ